MIRMKNHTAGNRRQNKKTVYLPGETLKDYNIFNN